MGLPEEVRHHFAGHRFGAPCSEADLHRAEAALGQPLPGVLRELYREFNGFLGPTDAAFFWPLFAGGWGDAGLVDINHSLREDPMFPVLFVSRCLFFGDDGGGSYWGFKEDVPGKVIRWDAERGEEFEVAGENLLEVWATEKKMYQELDKRAGA